MRFLGLMAAVFAFVALATAGPMDQVRTKAGLTSIDGVVASFQEVIHLPATLKQQFNESLSSFDRAMNGQSR